ncbi:hypothetical protein [uncultured Sphingorhabdus sp.]|uniref:hypothetical protein n=1 Tax=uncultured Sphingorhabdus sp. TaxID=1686106 RepID=UPI00262E7BBC|nr:hypothetical protein [uncultured Sphingorhabdus sp.]HMS20439.1 hypothetical protein [Sphingorhabdus sp.]
MEVENHLSPPQQMAVAHAPSKLRNVLSILLEFDNRMMAIASKGQESILKQLRYAWWREQLGKPTDQRPKGEPLLARITLENSPQKLEEALCELLDAWDIVVSSVDDDAQSALDKACIMRGNAIFGYYTDWVGVNQPAVEKARKAGVIWSRQSLGLEIPSEPLELVPGLKPLNLLLLSAGIEAETSVLRRTGKYVRLFWHALTNR